jgi:D-alanine-D-alanine ligase
MRVAVTYDGGAETGPPDAVGVLEAVDAVVAALVRLGHAAFPVAMERPFYRVQPRLDAVDRIFNLVEGLGGRGEDEPRLAALQELAGPPVTGARSDTLGLARSKDRVNALLWGRGLPVPPWTVVPAGGEPPDWTLYPAIVKPVDEDGSVGIHDGSVVDHPWALSAAVRSIPGDALVQAFIGGRELCVGIVGDAVLPVSEIVFAGNQRVVSYAAKWSPGSVSDRSTRPACPARIPGSLHGRLVDLARESWAAVGGRGYGRVDLRLDAAGEPFVLDLNPNPDLAPGAGLARMAEAAGWGYDGLIARILEEAA